ncbi:MAG TPA: hypothetical protein VJ866_13070 [Pyrinomonadaceae bacterium]|nr:hypothetical protein [Pyrinomonadaceae bacterium]
MSNTLAPTVHERLARCNERVYVDGLVTGAEVVLSVDGTTFSHIATGDGHTFIVPSLNAGAEVKAKQDSGTGFTPWSPAVIVEDALVPPQSAPVLPEVVGACSQCVHVSNVVPGSDVELRIGKDVVGKGTANSHGAVCVAVNLRKQKGEQGATLLARMIVCGAKGPDAARTLSAEPALPKPVVGSPLYGCQRVVPLSNIHRGARCRLEMSPSTSIGSFCSCWTAGNVYVTQPLVVGESVRAQCYWDAKPCDAKGDWSEWRLVVPPDEGIKPKVLEALIEGDQIIRVENQIVGATLVVRIRPTASDPAEEFGPRPASTEQEVGLNDQLKAGNVVSVVQTLCGVSFESDPVTVQPLPPVVYAPVIVPPLYDCGRAVQVSNLHPGALVRVYQNGVPIGLKWAGLESSISVPVGPTLVAGSKVMARQWVGNVQSPDSAQVPVQPVSTVRTPRILKPVASGDTRVWLSNVMPGSHVVVRSGSSIIGEADAAEPIVRVSTSPITAAIQATARLCNKTSKSSTGVTPIKSPCASGSRFGKVGEESRSYGKFTVPKTLDGGDFETPIEGQLYFPAASGGKFNPDATNLPLVVIAHGYWSPGIESYKGYDYLAQHLVQWGMLVFSVNMDEVNNKTGTSATNTQQYSRAEIILHTIDMLLGDSTLKGRINSNRIGLIGHSMGGEGVVVAQLLNESQSRGYSIKGVVSIAPTHWRPEVVLRHTKYMQLLGSMDLLTSAMTGTDAQAHFSGFRIYDRAWRPKTHFWIYGARHNPFNRVWVANGDTYESGWADLALPPQVHERIAKCLINAFFQDALLDQTAYAGYMEGMILPRSLSDLEIHTQHSKGPRTVLDNFGDADEEIPLAAQPLDKSTNSQSQAVNAGGAGLSLWDDVEHTAIAHSPHNTKGVQLGWNSPDATYLDNTGGISKSLTDVFALRVGQFYEDATLNPVAMPADLFVTLSDGTNEATVRLGAVAQVPYPDTAGNVLCPMRTVRLPLDAFRAANPALSVSNIQSVTLSLMGRATGNILADDCEFGS